METFLSYVGTLFISGIQTLTQIGVTILRGVASLMPHAAAPDRLSEYVRIGMWASIQQVQDLLRAVGR